MSTVFCHLTEEKIEPAKVLEFASETTHGAQTFFFGAVRAKNAGKDVVAVEYDAAAPLAKKVLHEISDESLAKWGSGLRICVIHRLGKLSVGEVSVAIGVSSPHRNEAYQASRYMIEQIKIRVPIWKKEYYLDGETEWLKGHALCQSHEHESEHEEGVTQ